MHEIESLENELHILLFFTYNVTLACQKYVNFFFTYFIENNIDIFLKGFLLSFFVIF